MQYEILDICSATSLKKVVEYIDKLFAYATVYTLGIYIKYFHLPSSVDKCFIGH